MADEILKAEHIYHLKDKHELGKPHKRTFCNQVVEKGMEFKSLFQWENTSDKEKCPICNEQAIKKGLI